MSATPLTAAGLAYARSACQRALHFFFDAGTISEQKYRERSEEIERELRRAVAIPAKSADFDEVSALVLTAPGVVTAIVQQTAALDRTTMVRGSNGQEIPITPRSCRDAFRVYINTGTAFAEETNTDLLAAVREAFKRCKLALPEGLAK